MQPEPTENFTDGNPTNTSQGSENASQHGILAQQIRPADVRDSNGIEVVASGSTSGEADADLPVGTEEQLRGLSLGDVNEPRAKPSFQRISEYENALSPSPPRKHTEGPGFKVVKNKGDRLGGRQLADFPNEVLTHILSHLPAASLSTLSLVSRQFHGLVTTPHAWRIAFTRFFPGRDAPNADYDFWNSGSNRDGEARRQFRSEQRFFTRLTALASWRSEYILRTRLLRSLARGKPAQLPPGHGASSRPNSTGSNVNAVVTYGSQLFAPVNHIHAVFGNGKKSPRFIHGTDELGSACTSDPNIGKIDNWGLSDPQALPQYADLFIGDLPYGEGDGPAGLPNCMDVSQPYGMVYGEGFPGGQAYFRSSEAMRGQFLIQPSSDLTDHESGIPRTPGLIEAISAVWISKSGSVPLTTDGLVGIMTGSTLGIVTSYSLGAETSSGRRIGQGQITAKWVLSPGVPIIAIVVDDAYNSTRKASDRVWAIALNALGEAFYLNKTPTSALVETRVREHEAGREAWNAGRTVNWQLVEPSRRIARDDPYNEAEIHGSYSPRSSSISRYLSKAQLAAETAEIEKFLKYRPSHFRNICEGWDMRRRLEADFAGDDGNGAGESMFVIKLGVDGGNPTEIRRFTRWRSEQASFQEYPLPKTPPPPPKATTSMASLFGGGRVITPARNTSPIRSTLPSSIFGDAIKSPGRISSPDRSYSPSTPTFTKLPESWMEEWRSSMLSFKDQQIVEITTTAVDSSSFANLTVDEDPLRTINGDSALSTPFATPSDESTPSTTPIPGSRARFLAVGTNTGVIHIWNMRGPQSSTASTVNELHPVRSIQTDSPQISCLAVSALYLIHGGNDGLVQTWDPLASTLLPIRTINSKFSSRARRRLIQAQASTHGVGINEFAAGAICIDPDPTVLRGMVSLGTHLRYWSYSSTAADQYQSKKRRLRRSFGRGTNSQADRFTNTGRGALMDYIATEQEELRKEKARRSREDEKLRSRFGVGIGGLSEGEALRYAELISAETFQKDQERRSSDVDDVSSAIASPEGSVRSPKIPPPAYQDEDYDYEIEEAIRLSLLDGVDSAGLSPNVSGSGPYDIPIRYKVKKSRRSASSSPSTSQASRHRIKPTAFGSKNDAVAADDLDFALQLSLAEEKSRNESGVSLEVEDEFPGLERSAVGQGKGKGRAV